MHCIHTLHVVAFQQVTTLACSYRGLLLIEFRYIRAKCWAQQLKHISRELTQQCYLASERGGPWATENCTTTYMASGITLESCYMMRNVTCNDKPKNCRPKWRWKTCEKQCLSTVRLLNRQQNSIFYPRNDETEPFSLTTTVSTSAAILVRRKGDTVLLLVHQVPNTTQASQHNP